MTNDSIPAAFLAKLPDARKTMWFNAMRIVKTGKAEYAQKAAQILDEYEAIELAGDRPEATEPAGTLMFEPHVHGYVSFGYADGQCTVSIRKTEQHRHEGNRVYQVIVLGQTMPETCRSIEEARELGAFEYGKRSGDAA
ncbi:hypothetical protein [Candidatus Halocynthiibacter alkanivorans]|uniref:hypothetical protein n=1 Tax=Candidatus Halocynthiibacter alkanivorans TaxID=2267619 RepID=UPI00109CB47F|nr:hypothetical protein [Candidatus Halocynthiibacter alkanivorans]